MKATYSTTSWAVGAMPLNWHNQTQPHDFGNFNWKWTLILDTQMEMAPGLKGKTNFLQHFIILDSISETYLPRHIFWNMCNQNSCKRSILETISETHLRVEIVTFINSIGNFLWTLSRLLSLKTKPQHILSTMLYEWTR